MFLSYLPVVFLLVRVGMAATDDVTLTTPATSTSSFTSNDITTITGNNITTTTPITNTRSDTTTTTAIISNGMTTSTLTTLTSSDTTTTTQITDNNTTTSSPVNDTTTSTHITNTSNDTTTTTPITDNNTTTSSPVNNTTTSTHITNTSNDTTTLAPITDNNTTTSSPVNNTTTSTHITNTSNDTTTLAPITQTSNDTTTTTPITSNTTASTHTTHTSNDTTTITTTAQTNNSSTSTKATTQPGNLTTPTPATTQTSHGTANTSTVTSETSTAVLTTTTLTTPINTSPQTPASTTTPLSTITSNTTLTAGPLPSSPTSISTASPIPENTSPGSSPAPHTGNTTTLSPSTTTSGETTTFTHSTEPASVITKTTISAGTTITVTTLRPTATITTNNSTTAAPPIPTQSPVIVCPAVQCPLESVCLNGTCQCISGTYLVDGSCKPAQVFPGLLHLTSLTFQNEMSNRSSQIFQETAAKISASLRDALKDLRGYKQSDVVQLQPGSVQATVNNIFENTNATKESIEKAIASSSGLLTNAMFTSTNLCQQNLAPCEVSTTTCISTNGRATCSCKEGYYSNIYSNTSCKACPSGQRVVENSCQPCAFGYSGFNCNDSSLLAVVVISCVLGGVLLILVLALLIYCCWRGCRKSKPDYSSSPYSTGEINQPWPTGITPIPRATSNCYAAPSVEMTEGGSTFELVDKKHQTNGLGFQPKQKGWKKSGSYDLNPEGMKTFTGKNPSRYSYLVQGHENPYFLPADGKTE